MLLHCVLCAERKSCAATVTPFSRVCCQLQALAAESWLTRAAAIIPALHYAAHTEWMLAMLFAREED
jgi:hypothetical protein